MKTTVSFFLLITLAFTSCEGFIHMQGHVYDSATKQPIENSQILLILKRKDTVRDVYYEYDSVSYQKRMELRKAGIKDDYGHYAVGGLSKKGKPPITDVNGKFTVGTLLVPCVLGCPTCRLVFIKKGYKQTVVKLDSIVSDSVIVNLEKLDDTISIR